MKGLMMDTPLMIGSIMDHAERNFPDQEIVSVVADQPDFRYTFKDAFQRTRQLGNALKSLGIDIGDRVGTLAWNDHRHFELYYAISSSGAICHTVNPRLFPEQLIYIMNHAEDKVVFCDPMFVPLLESIQDQLTTIEHFIVLTSEDSMPESSLKGLLCYESILAEQPNEIEWPQFDETTASGMCYTSGTTGDPKGVLYNHRATVLHAYAAGLPDVFGISAKDIVLPIVPMFHVNSWGSIYVGPMVGSKIVLPGPKMGDGETLQQLIEAENVTTGLLERVNRVELEGLITHELSRIRNRLALLDCTVAVLVAKPFVFLPGFVNWVATKVFASWAVAETDLQAVSLTRYPTALASALSSLDIDGREPRVNPKFCRHLWINPPANALIKSGFSTNDRVAALSEL